MGQDNGAHRTGPAEQNDIYLAAAILMDVASRLSESITNGVATVGPVYTPMNDPTQSTRLPANLPIGSGRGLDASGLSPREREVAALMAEGCSNRQIAEALFISIATVERHASNIFNKLGVRRRSLVAVWAAQQGLALTQAG